jgi:hypothetical protein
MGKLSGAVLIVAGVAVAAYALPARQQTGAQSAGLVPVAEIKEIKANAAPATGAPPAAQPKAAGAAVDKPRPEPSAAPPPPVAKSPEPEARPPVAKSPEPERHPQPLIGKVIPPPGPLSVAEAPPRVPVDHSKAAAATPLDKDGLTREIQRQLRRAGCYGGAITGVWSPAVRQAMKAFTDRVNAALPVEQPDQILLALVQNHEATCGEACPRGQAAGGDGRCLPNALLARAKKPNASARAKEAPPAKAAAPGEAGGRTADLAAPPPPPTTGPPPAGRMSLAGPPSAVPPDRLKPPTTHGKNVRRHAPAARPSRYTEGRDRDRRRAARGPYGAPTGWPWWAVPLFSP